MSKRLEIVFEEVPPEFGAHVGRMGDRRIPYRPSLKHLAVISQDHGVFKGAQEGREFSTEGRGAKHSDVAACC